MTKFHVNPNSGRTGSCSARVQCPFGGEDAHYATEAEARSAYEATQTSFGPEVKLQGVETPSESYLDPDAAREMWARGASVSRHDSPPYFNLKKPLGTSQGFMAGRLYSHSDRRWVPASFTPDGNLAFTDENRSFSSRAELAVKRWDEDTQEWQNVYSPKGGHEYDVAEALADHGYKRTATGMIAARDNRRMKKELSIVGAQRPSTGELASNSNSIRPPLLAKPAHIASAESKEKAEAIMHSLSSYPDDLEGSVPDPANYREAAELFYEEFDGGEDQTAESLQVQAETWLKSDDTYESSIGYFVLDEIKRK